MRRLSTAELLRQLPQVQPVVARQCNSASPSIRRLSEADLPAAKRSRMADTNDAAASVAADVFSQLPLEVVVHIIDMITLPHQLLSCMLVSQKWRAATLKSHSYTSLFFLHRDMVTERGWCCWWVLVFTGFQGYFLNFEDPNNVLTALRIGCEKGSLGTLKWLHERLHFTVDEVTNPICVSASRIAACPGA